MSAESITSRGAALAERYALVRELAHTGTLVVYDGVRLDDGRRVVVTMLAAAWANDAEAVARFELQAREHAAGGDPELLDYGYEADKPFMVTGHADDAFAPSPSGADAPDRVMEPSTLVTSVPASPARRPVSVARVTAIAMVPTVIVGAVIGLVWDPPRGSELPAHDPVRVVAPAVIEAPPRVAPAALRPAAVGSTTAAAPRVDPGADTGRRTHPRAKRAPAEPPAPVRPAADDPSPAPTAPPPAHGAVFLPAHRGRPGTDELMRPAQAGG